MGAFAVTAAAVSAQYILERQLYQTSAARSRVVPLMGASQDLVGRSGSRGNVLLGDRGIESAGGRENGCVSRAVEYDTCMHVAPASRQRGRARAIVAAHMLHWVCLLRCAPVAPATGFFSSPLLHIHKACSHGCICCAPHSWLNIPTSIRRGVNVIRWWERRFSLMAEGVTFVESCCWGSWVVVCTRRFSATQRSRWH